MKTTAARPPWYRILYVQVLIGVVLGILVGAFFPEFGKSLKPLGDEPLDSFRAPDLAPLCTPLRVSVARRGLVRRPQPAFGRTLEKRFEEVRSDIHGIRSLVSFCAQASTDGPTPDLQKYPPAAASICANASAN